MKTAVDNIHTFRSRPTFQNLRPLSTAIVNCQLLLFKGIPDPTQPQFARNYGFHRTKQKSPDFRRGSFGTEP
jgi:hypothetical protein